MCKNCDIVKYVLDGAKSNPHLNLIPVHGLLSMLIKGKRLEVYAGDCPFEDMLAVLSEEKHFTVSFYLRCTKCNEYFFYGACIRGTPIYRRVEDMNKENITSLLWGRNGVYFR